MSEKWTRSTKDSWANPELISFVGEAYLKHVEQEWNFSAILFQFRFCPVSGETRGLKQRERERAKRKRERVREREERERERE